MTKYGFNFSFYDYWSRAIVFGDAALRARLDESGNLRLFGDMGGSVPAGDYSLSWTGAGSVELRPGAKKTDKLWTVPAGNSLLAVTKGDVRNLRALLPGVAGTDQAVLYPPFVKLGKSLKPIGIRPMDWTRANDPAAVKRGPWDRRVPAYAQANVAKTLGCYLHYVVHHLSTDTEIEANLRAIGTGMPAERVAVELSNEIWNSSFPQYTFFRPGGGAPPHDTIARHLMRVWTIADRVLPGYKRYVAGHIGDVGFLGKILEALPAGTRVDLLGPGTYFGPSSADIERWNVLGRLTNAEILKTCLARIDFTAPKLLDHAKLAKKWNAKLCIYEWGLDLKQKPAHSWHGDAVRFSGTEECATAYVAMRKLHEECGVFSAYAYSFMSEWGSTTYHGHMETMNQDWRLIPKAREAFR